MNNLTRIFLVSLIFLPGPAFALVSEGRPGVTYFNHPLFLETKQMNGDQVNWVTLAYGDSRQGGLDCRNVVDVFAGREYFRDVPEKSWVLVDYELQSILIEEGFAGDADVSRVIPCGGPAECSNLSARLNSDPLELAQRKSRPAPGQTKKAELGDLSAELETGRQLVKAGRCRGCHILEGFGAEHAPSLTWKRYKYEPGWLDAYLLAPYRLRPAMDDLMMLDYTSPNAVPNLKGPEVKAVAQFLPRVAWAKTPADRFRGEPWESYDCFDCHTRLYREEPLAFQPTPVAEPLRQRLAASATMQLCLTCHAFGDLKTVAPAPREGNPNVFAPDLLLAIEKLEVNYLVSFVRDPNYLQPDAAMPALGLNEEQMAEVRRLAVAVKEAIAAGTLRPVHVPYRMRKQGQP
jgi:mono/diheme cytochrome c family protein